MDSKYLSTNNEAHVSENNHQELYENLESLKGIQIKEPPQGFPTPEEMIREDRDR